MRYKALILGAGQIAAGYDSPESAGILTHAHAYMSHPGFELTGFYDVNIDRAQEMAEKWGCFAFRSLADVGDVDVVSVCVPDEFHAQSVLSVSELLNPKCVLLEKPVARTREEWLRLDALDIPIVVNYSRRFSGSFQKLAARIKSGEFGAYRTGSGFYGKGFRHNGSHMVDLLRMLVGEIVSADEISRFVDYSEDDPTKTAVLHFREGGIFVMHGCSAVDFTVFEACLMFSEARIRVLDAGNVIAVDQVGSDERYSGYRTLHPHDEEVTDLSRSLYNAVDDICGFLSGGRNSCIRCTLKDGWEAIRHG